MYLREPGKGRRANVLNVIASVLLFGVISNPLCAADTNKGGQLYSAHCISCHGGNGVNAAPGSPSFERGQGLLRPDFALMEVTRTGKNAMPSYRGMLSNRDILDIIAYMRTLR